MGAVTPATELLAAIYLLLQRSHRMTSLITPSKLELGLLTVPVCMQREKERKIAFFYFTTLSVVKIT